ncbi:hypothetical protein VPH35_139376 [Triticum aestivum]
MDGGTAELRETHRLVGHADRAWALAWNPNPGAGAGPVLASCGADKTVRIWKRAPDGAWHCSDVLEGVHESTVRSCAWSPDGKLLADASFDGTTAIWEYSGGDFELVDTLEGHVNEVKSVSWSQSGSMVATCSRDRAAWIWEILPGNDHECVDVLEGHTEDVKMVQWHPFFDVLVSVSYDNTIRVWADDGDGKWPCVQTLTEAGNSGHSSTVWSISFNQKGDRMVTCSDDCTLKIWDASIDLSQPTTGEGHESWRHISTLSGYHGRTIFSVHWSSEGVIASGAGDDAICLFAEENSMVEGPSYRLILKKEKAHDTDVNCVRWCPQDVLDGVHERTVRSCAWSPDGKLLATASFDGTTAIWEYSGGDFECVATLEGHDNEVKSVSWSQSGSLLATCSRDKAVWIWEVQPGNEHECVAVLQGHTQDVKMVQWHPVLSVLVSVSYDNTIRVWADDGDDDWHCVQTLAEAGNGGHSSTVWSVSFNQKGDRMVTCSDDCTLKIWDTSADLSQPTTGEGHESWFHLSTLSGHHGRTIFSAHWSSEDVIASGAGDDAICLYAEEKSTMVEGPSYRLILKKEKAHDMDVNCVRWCPQDPRVLASASDDGTVKLWELWGNLLD